jgi:hypothetical protein
METLGQFISRQIDAKGFTKALVYRGLGMTAAGFTRMLENESISVKKYQEVCNILSIDVKEYFNINQGKTHEIDINQLNESIGVYEKSKKTVNEPLTSSNTQQRGITTQMDELIRQNSQLIAIIDRLTK